MGRPSSADNYGDAMTIIAVVRFTVAPPQALHDVTAGFERSAPSYQNVPGLIAKRFLVSDDGGTVGGVYHWERRADAEAFYDDEWSARIVAKYGAAPTVEYFQSPVAVTRDQVIVDE